MTETDFSEKYGREFDITKVLTVLDEGNPEHYTICGECGEDPEDCRGHFGSNLRELFYGARPLREIMGGARA